MAMRVNVMVTTAHILIAQIVTFLEYVAASGIFTTQWGVLILTGMEAGQYIG